MIGVKRTYISRKKYVSSFGGSFSLIARKNLSIPYGASNSVLFLSLIPWQKTSNSTNRLRSWHNQK